MVKAFLSHSSAQKEFVTKVSDILNGHTIIDSKDFETGMQNEEEIDELIQKSNLFVAFLSEQALSSKWVQYELKNVLELIDSGSAKRFYPIIIDSNITHNDPRIPEIVRKEYNLQQVVRPEKAARLIKSRLRELSWVKHPNLQLHNDLFVGRNEELQIIEERLDDMEKKIPTILISSGLNKVGRKKFLRKALIKTNTVFKEAVEFPIINLDARESIEDFILKLYDIGSSRQRQFPNFLEIDQKEKIGILTDIICDIYKSKEIVFIDDSGSIILPDGTISIWFWNLLENLNNKQINDQVIFCISARFRPKPSEYIRFEDIFSINISTLNKKEKSGLFKRLLELYSLKIDKTRTMELIEMFNGFPEQIYYTAELIKVSSAEEVCRNPKRIRDYNKEIFNKILQSVKEESPSQFLLTILVEFDFISFDLLIEILNEYSENDIMSIVDDLNNQSLIDFLGFDREYFKLNDGIKDFLRRSGVKLPEKIKTRLKEHILKYLENEDELNSDISDFFYSLKGALASDYNLKSRHILPSHYLKTMISLYEGKQSYREVILLADKVLENQSKLDVAIVREIKYWLCLSLARIRSERFKEEVQYFNHDSDYHFLFGFYNRLLGKLDNAMNSFDEALKIRPRFARAQRELVQVFIGLEMYSDAFKHAQYNYENDQNNAYHIQAYFDCLIRSDDPGINYDLITTLLAAIKNIQTDKAKEMALVAEADYNVILLQNPYKAMELIKEALRMFSSSVYLLNRKFLIAERSGDIEEMKLVVDEIKPRLAKITLNEQNQYYIMFSKVLAYQGNKGTAIQIINNSLKYYPQKIKSRIIENIYNIGN